MPDLDVAPRGVAQLSQGTLTDKALTELARLEREFLAEAVKLRERRGSWDRLAMLYDLMDALAAELSTLCRVLGFLSPWVPQVRDGEPTLAVLDGVLDPATTSLWKWPTLRSAIEWLDGQQVISYPEYRAMSEADKRAAFSIPPVRKIETLNVLKGALVDSFARGESVADFTRTAKTIVSAQTHAIERTYRTKSKQAYMQGVEVLTKSPRVKDRFPWVKYVATEDNRTRPTHRAMDGKIARADSAEAAEFKRLQNEYNCRCTLIPMTNAMVEREGVAVPDSLQSPPDEQPPLRAERRSGLEPLVTIMSGALMPASTSQRIAITGGPRTGKTTMSQQFADKGYTVKHTDDLISGWDWSGASEQASRWFSLPGPLCVEGVAVPRALRKFMERCQDKPIDTLVILNGAMTHQSDKQAAMGKGVETVLAEIIPALRRRGVKIVRLPAGIRTLEQVVAR